MTTPRLPDLPAKDQTSWLCWQYVLGELSPTETASFESQLEHDWQLAEQVATAVTALANLQQAVSPAPLPMSATVSSSNTVHQPRQPVSHWSMIAALSLACLTVGTTLYSTSGRSTLESPVASHAAVRLVHLWRDGSQHVRPTLAADIEDSTTSLDVEPVAVPSWMIAAVSLEQQTSNPGNADDEWETN
ncbi:hypothetical protein GC163_09540 [bacterium]|nr:hypothetical protein [bacterium]